MVLLVAMVTDFLFPFVAFHSPRHDRCRKIYIVEAYRDARGSNTSAHHHSVCWARSKPSDEYHVSVKLNHFQVIGDETSAIDSVLKADVWRDHLMKEQMILDTKLTALDTEGDEKRFEDAREDLSSRLAEVHSRLAEMDAASGPARAASLLAGMHITTYSWSSLKVCLGLGFDELDQQRPTKSFSGGWRCVYRSLDMLAFI